MENYMTDLQIRRLVTLLYKNETEGIDNTYHYTTDEITNYILRSDAVCLKMTNIEKFDDIYEGKTIEVYYDLALECLLKNDQIDKNTYELLSQIKVPQKNISITRNNSGDLVGSFTESDVYIACFSKEKDKLYMIEQYIKNVNKTGYCLSFIKNELESNEITDCFGIGFSFKLLTVKYGFQIIYELCDFIKELLSIPDKVDDQYILQYVKGFIENKLNQLKYVTKRSKFCEENEIRLILTTPKNVLPWEVAPKYFEKVDNGCIIKFPKSVIYGISKSPNLTKVEDEKLRKEFKRRKYNLN